MVKLDTYIADLLLENDCVIIPDFGGFVGNYQPAKLNSVNHRFDPPSKKISFNKLLVHNDGLLNEWVARQLGEAYPTATGMVREYVVYLRKELQANERVRIEKVGLIYKNASGQLQFEQARDVNFLLASTGLKSFYSEPVAREAAKPAPAAEPVVERKTIPLAPVPKPAPAAMEKKPAKTVVPVPETTLDEKREFNWMKVAAAVLLIPVAGYVAWLSVMTPVFKSDVPFHYSNLNPFTEKICTEYVVRTSSPEPVTELSEAISIIHGEEFMILVNKDESESITVRMKTPEATAVTTSVAATEALKDQRLRYHIIGGCFAEQSNAEGLVNTYRAKGANAAILDKKGGLYRVSVKSYATREEALDALESVRKNIPGAWLVVE